VFDDFDVVVGFGGRLAAGCGRFSCGRSLAVGFCGVFELSNPCFRLDEFFGSPLTAARSSAISLSSRRLD